MTSAQNPQSAINMDRPPFALLVGARFEGARWDCLYGGGNGATKQYVEGGLPSEIERCLSDATNVFGGQFLAMEQALGKLGQN